MGNNDYNYYDCYGQGEESPTTHIINQEISKDYKGEEGKFLFKYIIL